MALSGALPYPQEALDHFRKARDRGVRRQEEWLARLEAYRQSSPEQAAQLEEALTGDLPEGWDRDLDELFSSADKPMATREASGRVMNTVAERVHSFTGGSADLAPSTKTILKDHGHYGFEEYCGHNLHFGVREHAMGAAANGMALHGGIIPYTATFLIFSDYMRPPMRLATLMEQRVVYVFTHDSIGLGVEAWRSALERRDGPTALVLSRQNLPVLDRTALAPAGGARRGGYTLRESSERPDVILIGTGSEIHLALEAGDLLRHDGIHARVVSLPSWELFDAQSAEYRETVLPSDIKARVSIEGSHVLRVGALRRFGGGGHRHIPLWSVGPRWGTIRKVRPDSPAHGG